jgi:hypothetical protein
MTFRKRRVSASRYGGNDIDDPLWIVLVAVSSAIMKRVGAGGYKGLLPTEMNALYSEVPGAPNYNEEGFRSMFYHEIDEPVLPNQRPSDIGLATKYGLQRSGLYFAAVTRSATQKAHGPMLSCGILGSSAASSTATKIRGSLTPSFVLGARH